MFDSAAFFLSWFLVFMLCGAVLYIFDRSRGVKIWRWFYDMTHEHPLDAGKEFGFIYNRPARNRFTIAVILSLLQSGCAIMEGASSLTNEILSIFAEVPCLMFGFYLGPTFFRIWARREKVFDTVDQLEKGEISLKKEVQEVSHKALESVKDALGQMTEHEKPEPAKVVAPEPVKEPEPAIDPKEYLGKYINK